MSTSTIRNQEKFRTDYKVTPYLITEVSLCFQLNGQNTIVETTLSVKPNPMSSTRNQALVLDGENLELMHIAIDDETLSPNNYALDDSHLRIHTVPQQEFYLHTKVRIDPVKNSSLEGLYVSNGKYCTQCEAEGFRKITYYLDRPDVLAVFSVKIVADKAKFPFLLSNGNFKASGESGTDHWVTWHDPFPKPSYLFALVAGDFDLLEDRYLTASKRDVLLQIYVDKGKLSQCDHAMASLKKAMRWDEETFSLEYDLDRYMIVAVGDFNMGAMENKGLNVFNTKYVLANKDTATDQDFDGVESVIAHEYFHNWTGNRVTCRDWFQLSLKEGLTVFRDQEFSADMGSRPAKRINDVKVIRGAQFAEDAGPMSHPIRPDSYIEMNNFYTTTVYDKGAEVIRMMQTMLGNDGFRKGMDLYFHRHDGQAVTCDDFIAAMEDANGFDLAQFRRWYSQAGTPEVQITNHYNDSKRQLVLTIEQDCKTYHSSDNLPFHIPLKMALLDEKGNEQSLTLEQDQAQLVQNVLHIKKGKQRFVFEDIAPNSIPSLGRDFSAPIKIHYRYTDAELAFLLIHDNNDFNRWDASQTLYTRELFRIADEGDALALNPIILEAIDNILKQDKLDKILKAQTLMLPTMNTLLEHRARVDIDALMLARESVKKLINNHFASAWSEHYQRMAEAPLDRLSNAELVAHRYFKNLMLAKAMGSNQLSNIETAAKEQFYQAQNMTDQMAALAAIVNSDSTLKDEVLNAFYEQWQTEALVVDKWFSCQASSEKTANLDYIKRLQGHAAFDIKNPNKVRALIATFCALNFQHFHAADGSGYAFLKDSILTLNAINPQVSARLATAFNRCRKFDDQRVSIVKGYFKEILDHDNLCNDVYEIISKAHSSFQ